MSKKSESNLPGELNENWGSNYMMDGFFHDMEYGHGLLDSIGKDPIPQPSTSGMAQLPDGLMMAGDFEEELEVQNQDDEGAMDLENLGIVAKLVIDVDRTDVGLVDHSWLSDAYQDPIRLPDNPIDNMVPGLQDAWGDRTDGIYRIDLHDRAQLSYEDAIQHEEDDDPLQRDKLAKLVRMAMRRSASGLSMGMIKQDLLEQLGPKVARTIAKPVQAIEAEHGLVGNIYVRASAYPRLQHGKWAAELKRAAKGCRYLVASEGEDCESCATALGLKLVSHPNQIPWLNELERYAPRLRSSRKEPKKASSNPREYLRGWFLSENQSPRLDIETTKVRHTMPVDTITASEAEKSLLEFKVPHRVVLKMQERHDKNETERALKRVGAMVRAQLVTLEEATVLLGSKAPPQDILKAAVKIALAMKHASYSGGAPVIHGEKISKELAWSELRKAEAKWESSHAAVRERVAQDKIQQKVRLIEAQINGGLKGKQLVALIRETLSQQEALIASPLLTPLLRKTGALSPKIAETKQYKDATFTRHVIASSPDLSVSTNEIRKASRWLRQQMTEGVAGNDLDQLIQLRLGHKVVAAAKGVLDKARSEHEGISGHLYVEAAAYASAEGSTGCEQGALKHRANQLKFVLAMDRCGSCVFRNADSVCQKYNKELIDELSPEIRNEFQRVNLASHQMSDQEDIAAMFAVGQQASFAAQEFGLHNGALDEVETEAPQPELLDGIFFGGFEVS